MSAFLKIMVWMANISIDYRETGSAGVYFVGIGKWIMTTGKYSAFENNI